MPGPLPGTLCRMQHGRNLLRLPHLWSSLFLERQAGGPPLGAPGLLGDGCVGQLGRHVPLLGVHLAGSPFRCFFVCLIVGWFNLLGQMAVTAGIDFTFAAFLSTIITLGTGGVNGASGMWASFLSSLLS